MRLHQHGWKSTGGSKHYKEILKEQFGVKQLTTHLPFRNMFDMRLHIIT